MVVTVLLAVNLPRGCPPIGDSGEHIVIVVGITRRRGLVLREVTE